MLKKHIIIVAALILSVFTTVNCAQSKEGSLMKRIDGGKTIRIGFANEAPWAYPGEDDTPLGFVNVIAVEVLKQMGYEHIEPVITDWGGLIPGLKARRYDIITGGMYILNARCENIAYSEPIGNFGDAFIVPKGNPKGIQNFQDIKDKDAILIAAAGSNTIGAAKTEGIPSKNVMQVPGPTEILAAIKAGRADAGAMTYFTALNVAKTSGGLVEVTDPAALPEWTLNYVGFGFRPEDKDFLERFNVALKAYLGTDQMLQEVKQYGYGVSQLPGEVDTEWVCNNR